MDSERKLDPRLLAPKEVGDPKSCLVSQGERASSRRLDGDIRV